eukprot:753376-Hanusia_phi.AAC.2
MREAEAEGEEEDKEEGIGKGGGNSAQVVGDFDKDGYNDLIIQVRGGRASERSREEVDGRGRGWGGTGREESRGGRGGEEEGGRPERDRG